MTQQHTKHGISFALEKKAVFGLAFLLAALIFSYSYFVGMSVWHTVEREEFSARTERLSGKVAELERAYLSRSNTLTEDAALERGFVVATSPTYVARGTLSLVSSR